MILNELNKAVELTSDEARFATVLDYRAELDFHCRPVLAVERHDRLLALVEIGSETMTLPLSWKIVVADREIGEAEIVTVQEAVKNGHSILAFNPWTNDLPLYLPIRIVGDGASFNSPHIGKRQLLAVPLNQADRPLCVFVSRWSPHLINQFLVSELV